MSRRLQWVVVAGVVVVAGAVLAIAPARVSLPEAVTVGAPAPDFQARAIDGSGTVRRRSDYRGDVMLLNVWATWCVPCQKEMPSIERLYQEFGPRGLKVVAVSVDEPGAEAIIREFVRDFELSFEVLHDPSGRILQTYQMIGVPESFFIDARGVIRKKAFETDWYAPANRELTAALLDEAQRAARADR